MLNRTLRLVVGIAPIAEEVSQVVTPLLRMPPTDEKIFYETIVESIISYFQGFNTELDSTKLLRSLEDEYPSDTQKEIVGRIDTLVGTFMDARLRAKSIEHREPDAVYTTHNGATVILLWRI